MSNNLCSVKIDPVVICNRSNCFKADSRLLDQVIVTFNNEVLKSQPGKSFYPYNEDSVVKIGNKVGRPTVKFEYVKINFFL